jgi:hypothetical protein
MFKALFALALLLSPAAQAAIEYRLDLAQGFRWASANNHAVGYITSLQVGSVILQPDLSVRNPTTGASLNVTGVMESFAWAAMGGAPKQLSFNVSAANRQQIQALLKDPAISARDVKIAYVIFPFDPPRNRYFTGLKPQQATLLAKFVVSAGQIHFSVVQETDPNVPGFATHKAYIDLNPGRAEQFVLYTPSYGSTPQPKGWIHNGPRFQ